MRFSCYIFDLDNSLLYIPTPWEYFDSILVDTITYFSDKQIPSRAERNTFWNSGDLYVRLLRNWGVNLDDPNKFWERFDAVDFKKRKVLLNQEKVTLFPDVAPVLNKLHTATKKLGIVSNTSKDIVNYVVEQSDLKKYIQEIFALGYGQDQKFAKPSPAGIQIVLNNLGLNPNNSNALMIGDSAVDIAAAKHAKIKACLLKREENIHSEGYKDWDFKPDIVIDSLEDLITI